MDSFATAWGIVCSSWVHVNVFTSCRTLINPDGDCGKYYIDQANKMVSRFLCCCKSNWFMFFCLWLANYYPEIWNQSWYQDKMRCCMDWAWSHVLPKPRCVLLICLVVCCGGTFFIEQPRSSLMIECHRMQWLARLIRVPWTYHDADPIYEPSILYRTITHIFWYSHPKRANVWCPQKKQVRHLESKLTYI